MKRSLVLAGGGMRVAYQAGVLAALQEAGLRFHHIDGASGGTINLSMLLCGQGSQEIVDRWRTLDPRGFSSLLPLRRYVCAPRWQGLGDARGLRDKVFPHLGIDVERIRNAEGIDGTYNVCNFAAKTAEVVHHSDVDLDLLVAAVSLPVLMPAVTRHGTAYTDAVWIRDSNVPEAVDRGSDDIWLVWCIGNTPTYHNGSFRQYVHMIEMAANGSLQGDLDYVQARWPQRTPVLHVIKPQHPIPLDPAYYTGRIDAATLIDLGYQDACRYLEHPTPTSPPWGPTVTSMTEARPGATLRLDLEGWYAPGAPTPAAGTKQGRQDRTRIKLHVQLQSRSPGRTSPSASMLDVAGHVRLPGSPTDTLLTYGSGALDGVGGLSLEVGWRTGAGVRSLSAASSSGVLRLTTRDGNTVVGAGTVPFSRWRAIRALTSLHATDVTSSTGAMRQRTSLAASLVRAASISAHPSLRETVAPIGGPP